VLYLVTFVASIPTLWLKAPLDNPDFILGAGSDTAVIWACLGDVICAVAGIGTAVFLFPVLKRHSEGGALSFVTTRVLEAAILVVGAMSLMTIVTMRGDGGSDTGALVTTGQSFVALHDWAFLFGPGVMPALNALAFATIMYRTGLVPRWIPRLGLIGAPLLLTFAVGALFGVFEQVSAAGTLMALPIAVWELSVGVYMATKGFRRTALTEAIVAERPAFATV
jgi:hypothetical protein